jgi:predicted metalloendopeptidase
MTASETREAALRKMANFKPMIGYPDEWIDYSGMDFGPEGNSAPLITMGLAAVAF